MCLGSRLSLCVIVLRKWNGIIRFVRSIKKGLAFPLHISYNHSGNINAAGRRVLEAPYGPARVTVPLNTAISRIVPQTHIISIFRPISKRGMGIVCYVFALIYSRRC